MSPDMVSVIAAELASHQILRPSNCECGQRLTFGPFKPLKTHTEAHADHQAHAVLAALAEAGNVEWASQNNGWPSVLRCDSREAADKETARFPYLRTTVTRVTFPWERAG